MAGLRALRATRDREAFRIGSRTVETRKLLGQRLESTMEVTELDPPHRFAIGVVEGPVPFVAEADLSVQPDGRTRVDWVLEGESRGFFRVADTIVRKVCERELRSNTETLRDLLEAKYAHEFELAGTARSASEL